MPGLPLLIQASSSPLGASLVVGWADFEKRSQTIASTTISWKEYKRVRVQIFFKWEFQGLQLIVFAVFGAVD